MVFKSLRASLCGLVALAGSALAPAFAQPVLSSYGLVAGSAPSFTAGDRQPLSLDQSGYLRVVPESTELHTGSVGGTAGVGVASFTRPANATAYAASQMACASTLPASCTALQVPVTRIAGQTALITLARLTKSSPIVNGASFDLMLYKPVAGGACPVASNGDGAAYLTNSALMFIGHIPVTVDQVFTDGAKGTGSPAAGNFIVYDAPAGIQYACVFVKVLGAYSPASGETFTVALEAGSQN